MDVSKRQIHLPKLQGRTRPIILLMKAERTVSLISFINSSILLFCLLLKYFVLDDILNRHSDALRSESKPQYAFLHGLSNKSHNPFCISGSQMKRKHLRLRKLHDALKCPRKMTTVLTAMQNIYNC